MAKQKAAEILSKAFKLQQISQSIVLHHSNAQLVRNEHLLVYETNFDPPGHKSTLREIAQSYNVVFIQWIKIVRKTLVEPNTKSVNKNFLNTEQLQSVLSLLLCFSFQKGDKLSLPSSTSLHEPMTCAINLIVQNKEENQNITR